MNQPELERISMRLSDRPHRIACARRGEVGSPRRDPGEGVAGPNCAKRAHSDLCATGSGGARCVNLTKISFNA
jgi:hypothetical protein